MHPQSADCAAPISLAIAGGSLRTGPLPHMYDIRRRAGRPRAAPLFWQTKPLLATSIKVPFHRTGRDKDLKSYICSNGPAQDRQSTPMAQDAGASGDRRSRPGSRMRRGNPRMRAANRQTSMLPEHHKRRRTHPLSTPQRKQFSHTTMTAATCAKRGQIDGIE